MDLSTASNHARVLLSAFKGLQHLDGVIDAAAKAEQLEREARQRLSGLQNDANALAIKLEADRASNALNNAAAKKEADEMAMSSKAVLEDAKNKARAIEKEAEDKASLRTKEAAATLAEWGEKLEETAKAVAEKEEKARALEAKIVELRSVIANITANIMAK